LTCSIHASCRCPEQRETKPEAALRPVDPHLIYPGQIFDLPGAEDNR
jgi:hypothetical protein